MRWMFRESNQPEERDRKKIESQITEWWLEFKRRAPDINAYFKRAKEFDLPAWMSSSLQSIDSHLFWEFGPAVNVKGHRLVITPESSCRLRPLTNEILSRAPKISGWEFYPFRLEENLEWANNNCEGRASCRLDGASVTVAKGKHNRVDLKYCFPESIEESKARHAAFVATESLLGEECLDAWIGAIEILKGREKRALKLDRLQPSVHALIEAIREQLPTQPCYVTRESSLWTSYKLEPEERADYSKRDDLFYASTMRPEMWQNTQRDILFFSKRFSRCDETFCYLKIDGEERDPHERLDERMALEERVNEVLVERKLGAHVGGGMGRRYAYIDLALTDVKRAIPVMREVLQSENTTHRSWLLFFDSYLNAEWVGIWSSSPPPLMLDEED